MSEAEALPSDGDPAPSAPRAEDGHDRALGKAVLRGSALTFIGYGASLVIRLGSNVIVTRLLIPDDFGLMALVNVFLIGLIMLSDVGIGPSIIQNPRGDDPVFLNTAWTVQLLRGVLVWLASCALAWPMASLYGKPELLTLVPVASLAGIIGGAEATRLFTLNRQLALGRITLVELVSQAAGAIVMVGLAWVWRSVWALVAGGLVAAGAKTLLSHTVLPGIRNRLAWEREARASLFDFGRWIFVSTALTYLSSQSDRLLLGKLVTTRELGIYATAATLAAVPSQVLNQISSRAFYPAVSRMMARDGGPAAVREARRRLLHLAAPLIGLGIALVSPLASILYDQRYAEVGALATWLSLGTWLNAVTVSYGVVVLAVGQPKYISIGTGVKTVAFILLVWPATAHLGPTGAAVAMSASEIAVTAFCWAGARRSGVGTLASDLGASLLAVASAVAGLAGFYGIRAATGSRVVAFAAVALAAAAVAIRAARKLRA